jgi:hypothetical protein
MLAYDTELFLQPSSQITEPSESCPAEQLTPPCPEQAPEAAKENVRLDKNKEETINALNLYFIL